MDPPKKKGPVPEVDVSKNATVIWRCIPCDKIFSEEEINLHRNRVHSFSFHVSQVCDTCGVLCESYNMFRCHMIKHEAEKSGKRMVCKLCNRGFIFMKDLKKHLRSHSKERPHICEICGKSFKSASVMRKHIYVHSGVKPHTCEYCGKGFKDNYNLKGHVRTHTGEKPFQCDMCSAAFTHNVSLKTHKRSAHGIDMWKDQKPQELQEFDHMNLKDPENMYNQYQVKSLTHEDKDAQLQESQKHDDTAPASSQNSGHKSEADSSVHDPGRHAPREAGGSTQVKMETSTEASYFHTVGQDVKSETVQLSSSSFDSLVTVPIRPLFHHHNLHHHH